MVYECYRGAKQVFVSASPHFVQLFLVSRCLLKRHFAVNACLMPVLAADGCHVTTVEGIGTVKGSEHDHKNLHPVQKAMVDMHGSQCGELFFAFCMCVLIGLVLFLSV